MGKVYPFPTCFCFIGLILGGVPAILKPAKESLAKKAIDMLEPGRSIFLDSGTTMMTMASLLPEDESCNACTRKCSLTTTRPGAMLLNQHHHSRLPTLCLEA